jgi:dTDP-4-dehydrorhamnose 3,5-epimerase
MGVFQVGLVDLRKGSATFGRKNTLYVGSLRPWQILIPPGVGHGYKVIGLDPAMLVYVTNKFYNPKDEGRVAYNESGIAYDWELQYK